MEHPDLEALLEATLPFAQQLLKEHGVFPPFGAALQADGRVAMVTGGPDENAPTDDLLDTIEETLRHHALEGNIRAAAVCSNIRITPEEKDDTVDAIRISLEHEDGEALDLVMPYTRGEKEINYGQLGAAPLEPYLFAP